MKGRKKDFALLHLLDNYYTEKVSHSNDGRTVKKKKKVLQFAALVNVTVLARKLCSSSQHIYYGVIPPHSTFQLSLWGNPVLFRIYCVFLLYLLYSILFIVV